MNNFKKTEIKYREIASKQKLEHELNKTHYEHKLKYMKTITDLIFDKYIKETRSLWLR